MKLTDEILQGNIRQVEQILTGGADVNQLDLYGYTPLIEAAIANRADIAHLLIEHGADVNKKDLVGGSPLSWAVENYNLPLCELLLKHQADPNAYSNYGQPVLILPILRRQQNLKELLYRYGADLKFAQDYINAKLLGHRFELIGRVDIVDHRGKFIEIDLEGFILEFTVAIVQDSLAGFRNNFAARHLRPYFSAIDAAIAAFQAGAELIKYQQYSTDIHKNRQHINLLAKKQPLLLPVGYEGHAITFIRYGRFIAKCDRGENSLHNPSVMIYSMRDPQRFTPDFVEYLLYKKQNRYFVTEGIVDALALERVADLPLPSQLTGNCSWANVEAAFPTLIYLHFLEKSPQLASEQHQHAQALSLSIYHQWAQWDKDWALHQCVESFYDANPARKASKAALLAATLAQTCHYTYPEDRQRAHKILAVLSEHHYRYVLDSYLEIYKNTALGHNLRELIDLYQ